MKEAIEDVSEFHRRSKTPILTTPEFPSVARIDLRERLFVEEGIREFLKALHARDMVGVADGIIDTIYVLIGCGLELGLPLEALWQEVQKKNLEKFVEVMGPDGVVSYEIYKDAGGKVVKPPGWTPPDIEGILRRHGWKPRVLTKEDVRMLKTELGFSPVPAVEAAFERILALIPESAK